MSRDLIIGIIVSLLLHGGVGFGGELLKHLPKKSAAKTEEKTIVVDIKPPPVEPEDNETDTPQDNQPQVQEQSFAPPSLVDVPGTVDLNSFTQAIQPPPPPNVNVAKGMTIPKGNPNVSASKMSDVFNPKDLDQQVQPKPGQVQPAYPYELKRSGIAGFVVVEYIVDANGNVIDVTVKKSSHREFENPTVTAVLKWKFRPGRKGGKAVKSRVLQQIDFQNKDE